MPRKIDSSLIDHAAQLIKSGFTLNGAAGEVGVHAATLSRKLKESGFKVHRGRGGPKKLDLPIEDIKAMYQNGHSENAVSKHFGSDRGTIRKRLLEAGVRPRTQSEAEKLKWAKMDEQSRINQVKNAHEAVRGMTRRDADVIARAKTREQLKYSHLIGRGEFEFCELLSDRGISFTHQKAVEGYNIDIAIGNVAVELASCRGRYSPFNAKEINRAEKLLERGYHVVGVEFDSVDTLIKCADDVLAYVDLASDLKPTDREYWVVRCRAQDYAIITNDLGQFASVPAPVQFIAKRSVIDLG